MHDDLKSAEGSGLPVTTSTPSAPAVRRAPKFRNTENPAETWMGRGKRPNWLKAQLAAGRSLNDFRING
jgi:DNA-binding protein H-NS